MTVLALGAHPDDLEYGCGGTLALYAQQGHRVVLFVASDGDLGGDAATRRREQQDAATILGAHEIVWGGYHDLDVPRAQPLIGQIERLIADFRPDLLLVNAPEDSHQDHQHLAAAALAATRYCPNILLYEEPSTRAFTPTVFMDIGSVLDRKLQALDAHRSQVSRTHVEDMTFLDWATSTATFRGIQARVRQAEGFVAVRITLNPLTGTPKCH